jgi:hypothetical protein
MTSKGEGSFQWNNYDHMRLNGSLAGCVHNGRGTETRDHLPKEKLVLRVITSFLSRRSFLGRPFLVRDRHFCGVEV